MDDSSLIERVLAGEREAFPVLFQRHSAPLLATIQRTLGNQEDARDVLQETWLRAFESLGLLQDPRRLRAWLLSIALNLVRASHRRPPHSSLAPGDEHEPWGASVAHGLLEEREELAAVHRAMSSLPARQREVVDLRVNHELTHAEIADLIGISEQASRANYYQGLRQLKDCLERRSSHER